MSEQAIVAIAVAALSSAGIVLAALMPAMISTRRKASAAIAAGVAAREAVTNSHPEHIRDMLDRYQQENRDGFRDVAREIGGVKSDVRGVRRDIGRMADEQVEQSRRLRLIELREERRGDVGQEVGE